MTFYEAALRVLEEAGTPLLSADITKRAVEKGLLSHVGKNPELTMLLRLAAMAKRPRDRKLQVTAKDTFALLDWMLPEDAEALAATGVMEPNPEDELPPYRPEERHPEAHAEYLRSLGSRNDRKRRDDDRKKKFPPMAEVAFEALQEAGTALPPGELLARLKAREACADDTSVGLLIDALASDNQRRVDESRRPQFVAARSADNNELQLSIEVFVEGGLSPVDAQQAFCQACNLKFENGRVMLRREQRQQERAEESPAVSAEDRQVIQTARLAGKDARKAFARIFRAKLMELEQATFEKACSKLLRAQHFHDLKVVRRAKEGPLLTARRREGSLELRYVVRFLRVSGPVERRHVQDVRRELAHTGANVALLVTANDARGDARGECTTGALVQLWAGDALSEKFFEAKVGVTVTSAIEFFDIDEAFFAQAKLDAEDSLKRREERQRERDERQAAPTPPPPSEGQVEAAEAPPAEAAPEGAEGADDADGDDDGDDEGGDEAGAPGEPGASGEGRRRRRRRRRRRGGRGNGPREGEAQAGGAPAPSASAPQAPAEAPVEAAPPPPPAPPADPGSES